MKPFRPANELRVPEHTDVMPPCPVIDMHTHFGALLFGPEYEKVYDTAHSVAMLREMGVVAALSLELAWGEEYDRLADKLRESGGVILPTGSVDIARALDRDFAALALAQVKDLKRKGSRAVKLWKNMTLHAQRYFGCAVGLDDPCYKPLWDACAQEDLPVIIHVADPPCFFREIDLTNEHYFCLSMHPEWSFHQPGVPSFAEHMAMQEKMVAANPHTTFIVAHVGSYAENLAQVGAWMDRYPNLYIDVAARIDQLGRQPYTAREFMIRYADRILFGSDYEARFDREKTQWFYHLHYRFFQTADEYFEHPFPEMLGQWRIYGLNLPQDVLYKLYYQNAARLLKIDLPGQ